jgi:hypothetical protein
MRRTSIPHRHENSAGSGSRPGQGQTSDRPVQFRRTPLARTLATLLAGSATLWMPQTAAAGQLLAFERFSMSERDPVDFAGFTRDWHTGDRLVLDIDTGPKSIGGMTGSPNAVVIPAIDFGPFGKTPAVRADTRTGVRLTTDIDLRAGAILYANVSTGGYKSPVTSSLAPTLLAPSEVKAGSFFSLGGSLGLQASMGHELSLPSFNAGLDVLVGGSAKFTAEAAVPLVLRHTKGTFNLDLGEQRANVFDVTLDFKPPKGSGGPALPVLDILGNPAFLSTPGSDNLFRKKLPDNPLQSFGEIAVVNPVSSRRNEAPQFGVDFVSNSVTGRLFTAALDIDGILTSAISGGVSYSGLELDLNIGGRKSADGKTTEGGVSLGKLSYDILDVKYGLELGYRETSTVSARLGARLDFVNAETGEAADVLIRDGATTRIASFDLIDDWTELPDLALLGNQDVDVRVQFTGLERELTRSLDLTLGDFFEVKAWQAKLDLNSGLNLAGLPDLQVGPFAQFRTELAGEFASERVITQQFEGLRDTFDETTWAPRSFRLNATPVTQAYLENPMVGSLDTSNLRRLDTHTAPTSLADTEIIIGTAEGSASSILDVNAVDFVDRGQLRSVQAETLEPIKLLFGGAAPFPRSRTITRVNAATEADETLINGLVVQAGSTYTLAPRAARRFRMNALENDGEIVGGASSEGSTVLSFQSREDDGLLRIQGSGSVEFQGVGIVQAGVLLHGEGHTIHYGSLTPYQSNFRERLEARTQNLLSLTSADPDFYRVEFNGGTNTRRWLDVRHTMVNEGAIIVSDSTLNANIGSQNPADAVSLRNTGQGAFVAHAGGALRIGRGSGANQAIHIENTGFITASGTGRSGEASRLELRAASIAGGASEEDRGLVSAVHGGHVTVGTAAGTEVTGHQQFIAAANGVMEFAGKLTAAAPFDANEPIAAANVELRTDTTGTMVLRGLERTRHFPAAVPEVRIFNAGLLDVVSGDNSLREADIKVTEKLSFGFNPGAPAPLPRLPRLAPINFENEGTLRVRAGARFAFDANILDYAEGGARLAGGTWEVLGADRRSFNTTERTLASSPDAAILDVSIRNVFATNSPAGRLSGLSLGEEVDPDTGQLRVNEPLGQLDTTIRFNDAKVTLGGNARFALFNSVHTNQGELTLKNRHQFVTDTYFENRGGTTRIESGAGLHVNGALIVNGGDVHFADGTEFTLAGDRVQTSDDGSGEASFVDRDIEVVGGNLRLSDRAAFQAGLLSEDRRALRTLLRDRNWVVRENRVVADDGSETVTAGRINLVPTGRAGGVVINQANVTLDGAEAYFEGFEESLVVQGGSLTITGGKQFQTDRSVFENRAGASLSLITGGFEMRSEGARFENYGNLTIDVNSYLSAENFTQRGGSVLIDGQLETRRMRVVETDARSIRGSGTLRAESIEFDMGFEGGDVIDLLSGTLISENIFGSLNLEGGEFRLMASDSPNRITGNYSQSAEASLRVNWGAQGGSLLEIDGSADLGGGIKLDLVEDFIPEIGESLAILSANSLNVRLLDTVLSYDRSRGRSFGLRYENNIVFLDALGAPVPVPAAVWLLGSALGLVATRARKRAGLQHAA